MAKKPKPAGGTAAPAPPTRVSRERRGGVRSVGRDGKPIEAAETAPDQPESEEAKDAGHP